MKINFARRTIYRKKSERLYKWIFWGGVASSVFYVGSKYFQKTVTPTEDPHRYATHFLMDILIEKYREIEQVDASDPDLPPVVKAKRRNRGRKARGAQAVKN